MWFIARAALAAVVFVNVLTAPAGAATYRPGGDVRAPAEETWKSWKALTRAVPTDRVHRPLIRLADMSFIAGARYYLRAQWAATSAYGKPILQGGQIRCVGPNGGTTSSVFTTRNAPPGGGTSTITVHWIYQAPASGRYTCELLGHADVSSGESRLSVVEGQTGTYLVVAGPEPDAQEWRTASTALKPGGRDYILRNTYRATTGRTVDVYADVELTNDYHHGEVGRTSTVKATLYATRVDGDGKPCGVPPLTATVSKTISSEVHHDKIYLVRGGIPKGSNPVCSDRFAIKVLLEVGSGNPVRVEGGVDKSVYTNAIAWTRP